jgi:hypothetical protein
MAGEDGFGWGRWCGCVVSMYWKPQIFFGFFAQFPLTNARKSTIIHFVARKQPLEAAAGSAADVKI